MFLWENQFLKDTAIGRGVYKPFRNLNNSHQSTTSDTYKAMVNSCQ